MTNMIAAEQAEPDVRSVPAKRAAHTKLFTLSQINESHSKMKNGADFPAFVRELVGSSRVDLQACKLEYSIVSPK